MLKKNYKSLMLSVINPKHNMLKSKYKHKTINIVKLFIILALLTTISGCRALSDALDPDKNTPRQDLPSVKREKPNLSSEPAKIDVDPNSDDLIEVTENEPSSVGDNSNVALATNNNSTNENSTLTEADTDNNPNTEQENVESSKNYIVTFNSFGDVKIGTTPEQASQTLGTKLVRGDGYEDACYYVEAPNLEGVRFMVTNGKIARIDISNNKYATDKGAKIGDTEDKIKSLYKGINVNPQKYDEKKHDMEIYSSDERFLIIFETDGKRVTGFRAGNAEEVGYVEGCS